MDKIRNYLTKNIVGVVTVVTLLLFVFVVPSFASDSDAFLWIVRITIVIIGLTYLFYKIYIFKANNPTFKAAGSTTLINVLGSIIAIVIGLLFGFILMLFVSPANAAPGFFTIIIGGFKDLKNIGMMIYASVPIILTGLSVAFAFRTGLFNIGATGQLTMGAFVSVFIGVKWGFLGDISPLLHWGVALLGALVAGGLWGAIPGLLKAYRNVNEVVASIMLNYVAMYLNTILITNYIYNSDYARAQDIQATAATPLFNLDLLFPNSSVNAGIVVAIVVVIILHIILNKTTFGYELKAVGFNRDASKYAGMNAKRNIVFSMMISGAVSGLAGAMMFLVQGKHLKPENILLQEGFTGIAISLLGLSSPIGVLLAGLFYGSLNRGGFNMQLYDFKPEIIDIIIAVIIYASALALFLQTFVIRRLKSKEMSIQRQEELAEIEGGEQS
jgi:simple sugar transport system permease protein